MKQTYRNNMRIGLYEVTIGGSVYKRGVKGEIRRVKGREALAVKNELAQRIRAQTAEMRAEIASGKGVKS